MVFFLFLKIFYTENRKILKFYFYQNHKILKMLVPMTQSRRRSANLKDNVDGLCAVTEMSITPEVIFGMVGGDKTAITSYVKKEFLQFQ